MIIKQKYLYNILIVISLFFYSYTFFTSKPVYPFYPFDIYKQPISKPVYNEFSSYLMFQYYAIYENNERYLLPNKHFFFTPFTRFLFSEVLFFNTMRIEEKSPLTIKDRIYQQIKAQIKQYNLSGSKYNLPKIKTILVVFMNFEMDEATKDDISNEYPFLEVKVE
jgi:hypothetical protein